MSESSDTPAVQDNRVTDADGREVDNTTLDWLTFIALHMDEDRDFGFVELLDDTLLALGYRDPDARKNLSGDGQPHVLAHEATLDRLLHGGLLERQTGGGPRPLFRLTADVVDDIRNVRAHIGQFWGFAGSADAIDSYAELALLVIIALRIQDGNRASRDDLADRLASLLGDRDDDATTEELTDLMERLESRGYVDAETDYREFDFKSAFRKTFRRESDAPVFGTDWALDDKAWGGLSALREALLKDFADPTLPEIAHHPATDLRHTRDDTTEAQQRRSSRRAAGKRDRNRSRNRSKPKGGASRRTSGATAGSTGEPHVSDVDLCVATLQALAEYVDDEAPELTEQTITDHVIRNLRVPDSYTARPLPPWATRSKWAEDLEKSRSTADDGKSREPKFFDYRMEHVFRALSIEQTGWVFDVGLTAARPHSWKLTRKGELLVASPEFQGNAADLIERAVDSYFQMHRYADWTHEEWMDKVVSVFEDLRPGPGGVAFEHLTKELVERYENETHELFRVVIEAEARDATKRGHQVDSTKPKQITDEALEAEVKGKKPTVTAVVQEHNDYLDRAGVDVVVQVQLQGRMGMGGDFSNLLMQCKRHFVNEISPDAASKLFATTMWLKGQADRKDVDFRVLGARLAFLGDLSREAAWTFWALRSAWNAIAGVATDGDAVSDAATTTDQSDLIWDIWDGQRILWLMAEYGVGVYVNDDGVVEVDEQYLRDLATEP